MKSLRLLDCTLRDGGYVNDWHFGHSVIIGTYKRLDSSGADFIEVGFLDDRRPFDINRTIQPNTECYDEIFKGVEKKHAIPVAMIDFGTCSIDNIADCADTFIDGIRVIFKKEKIEQALPFCKAIKDKGYKLFIQAISITAYSDIEMLQYVEKINEIHPFAFSIVDTYGFLDQRKLDKYFSLIDNNLDTDIALGYHGHNNFQLAFSNTLHFIQLYTNRMLIADATIYGMGKSAGNCPIETIALYMNQLYGKNYDVCQYLEILDTDLMSVYQNHYWGYKYNFYISAMQNCHPNYVQYLLNKKTLSISSVNTILSEIPEEIKLHYNADYIEKAYLEYQSRNIDDTEAINSLSMAMSSKNVLVIAPGRSLQTESTSINNYINEKRPVVVSVNFDPDTYEVDYVFVSNAKRYSKLSDISDSSMIKHNLIVTSNIVPYDRPADYILNYSSLQSANKQNSDNALLLLLAALAKMTVKEVALAGFDGYSASGVNYFDAKYEFGGNDEYYVQSNEVTINGLRELVKLIKLTFVTKSLYSEALK